MVYLRLLFVILFQVVFSMVAGFYLAGWFINARTFAEALFWQALTMTVLMLVSGYVLFMVFLI